jgi:hypothetical protein
MKDKNGRIERNAYKNVWKASKSHFFQDPYICFLLILVFIGADGMTLYTVLEPILQSKMIILFIITVIISAVINIDPMLLAASLRNKEYPSLVKKALAIMLIVLFIIIFGATFALRFTTREKLFESSGNYGYSEAYPDSEPWIRTEDSGDLQGGNASVMDVGRENGLSQSEDEFVQPTAGQNAVAVLLGLEPLVTSIVSFYLSYEQNPDERKQHQIKLQLLALKNKEKALLAVQYELSEDRKNDLEVFDQANYETVRMLLWERGNALRVRAREMLAERERTPEAVEYLMEGFQRPRVPDALAISSLRKGTDAENMHNDDDEARKGMSNVTVIHSGNVRVSCETVQVDASIPDAS